MESNDSTNARAIVLVFPESDSSKGNSLRQIGIDFVSEIVPEPENQSFTALTLDVD